MSTITVLCNEEMTSLLPPADSSATLRTAWGSSYLVAEYDFDELSQITEEQANEAMAFWREVGPCNTTIPWKPNTLKRVGLFNFLCDYHGISSARNLAVAVDELAKNADMTPIQLMNWCVENTPSAVEA